MRVRVDRRTPLPTAKHIREYPIGQAYKYLGVEIQDNLCFDASIKNCSTKTQKLYNTIIQQASLD